MAVKDISFGPFLVTLVTIVRGSGTDKVSFSLGGAPPPFPEMDNQEPGKYDPHYTIEVRRGYAEEWLRKTYRVSVDSDPDVRLIDTSR